MREADAIELVEKTPLEGLAGLSPDIVYAHVDYLGRELPGPVDLYQRWERQQWSATDIDFAVDRQQWEALPGALRTQLQIGFAGFFYGEQAVTDTLSPLVHAAPSEDDRLFLSTQLVDEARHSYFFARVFNEVLGIAGGLHETLAHAIEGPMTGGYGRIFDPERGELVTLTEAVRIEPHEYSRWVQAITIYHLLVEGVLALPSQRRLLRILRASDLLPGFRAGFTAVTRDESRHVSYGVWALREAVKAGHEADIRSVVDRALPSCLVMGANPAIKLPDPAKLPAFARLDPREQWGFTIDSMAKRLRTAAIAQDYVADVESRSWQQIWGWVDEYERRHDQEHPVRAWERGEVQAASV